METRRRRLGYLGLLVVMLSAGLLWTVQPVGAAGTPPIIRTFNAHAENRVDFTEPHLGIDVQVDDPDGQVPLTIQSVMVTGPDGRTFDLTNRFSHPNLNFRGGYFPGLGTPVPTGTYTVTVTDKDGNIATCPNGQPGPCTDALNAFPSLLPANVTSPQHEQILTTTTPTFQWDAIVNAGSVRVQIRNADQGQTSGDGLYTGPFLPGTATQFTLPSGVLAPGRRYALRLEAFDTSTGLPTANIRATSFRNFSVAGPNVALFLRDQNNQTRSAFRAGDTLHLGVNFRNDNPAPMPFKVTLWAGLPGSPPIQLRQFDVPIPPTPPDVSTTVNDFFVFAFKGTEPTGNYVLRLELASTGLIAQAIIAFSFSP